MIDDYEIQDANESGRGLSDVPAALALVAHAIRRQIHFPANGARVIFGWADRALGETYLTDEPVLWFDAEGEPVTTARDAADPIRNGGENTSWCLYHPDARRIGSAAHSARDEAVRSVEGDLHEYLEGGDAA